MELNVVFPKANLRLVRRSIAKALSSVKPKEEQ